MKKIKIAVIHAAYLDAPKDAMPGDVNFSKESALAYIKSNINYTCGFIRKAGQAGADMVCTNEDFPYIGMYLSDCAHPGLFRSLVGFAAEEIHRQMRSMATEFSMLIASNNYELRDGKIYNTSTMYGRSGEVLGRYEKVHMPSIEYWKADPGETFNIVETDIGKIGFAICYDMIYPETCRILALNGADIIVHQTQGWGGGGKARALGEAYIRVRAVENSVYMVVAKNNQRHEGERSMVVDNNGEIIGESDALTDGLLITEFEPDFQMTALYQFNNFYAGVASSKARQFLGRKPKLYRALINEETTAAESYKGQKLICTEEDGQKLMDNWANKPEEEKRLYHW